jgi:hypothetical protein
MDSGDAHGKETHFFFLAVTEFELKASHLTRKYSICWAQDSFVMKCKYGEIGNVFT